MLTGRGALNHAACYSNLGIVQVLTGAGTRDTGSALMLALDRPDSSVVEHLLREWEKNKGLMKGEYITHTNHRGDSPLALSVVNHAFPSSCRRVRFLLDIGADDSFRFGGSVCIAFLVALVEYKLLGYQSTPPAENVAERLAGIGRLLKQTDAIRAGSWLWPLPVAGEKARPKKAKAIGAFRVMIGNMRRGGKVKKKVACKVLWVHEFRISLEAVPDPVPVRAGTVRGIRIF